MNTTSRVKNHSETRELGYSVKSRDFSMTKLLLNSNAGLKSAHCHKFVISANGQDKVYFETDSSLLLFLMRFSKWPWFGFMLNRKTNYTYSLFEWRFFFLKLRFLDRHWFFILGLRIMTIYIYNNLFMLRGGSSRWCLRVYIYMYICIYFSALHWGAGRFQYHFYCIFHPGVHPQVGSFQIQGKSKFLKTYYSCLKFLGIMHYY